MAIPSCRFSMKTSADKQEMITCFVQMVGESTERAQQFLQASNWQLEEAIQLFNAHSHSHGRARGTMFSSFASPLDRRSLPSSSTAQNIQNDTACDYARPPLSGKRKSMCDPEPLIPNMDNGSMVRPDKRQREVSDVSAPETLGEVKGQLLSFLPEEPQEGKGLNICRVCVRFPDGQRVQRRFLRTDPMQLLWSFCFSQVQEAAEGRPFRLAYIVPGASQTLNYYHRTLSFGDAGFSNSLISMIWE